MFSKKGQLGNLQGIIMSLVVVGILVGSAFFVLGEFMDQAEDLGQQSAVDGINETIDAMDTIPNLLPLVVLIAMVVIILALVFTIPGARSRA
jgi:cell division protein FtsX|tara:strand:- start:8484 stop:8759 length:276 start_codon:yes stop_codon:yes gene_type:complete